MPKKDVPNLTSILQLYNIVLTMLETPHVFVGAAIATIIPNPFIAIPLAFASHFVMELVPHWNPHLNTETEKFGQPTRKSTVITAIDSTIALVSGTYIAYRALPDWKHALVIFLACFASVLPDVIEGPYFFLGFKNKLIKKWINIHKLVQNDSNIYFGFLAQFAVIISSIFWMKH